MDPLARAPVQQHAGLSQYCKVTRYLGLWKLQSLGEITYASLGVIGQQEQNSQARGVCRCSGEIFRRDGPGEG